MKKNSSEPEFRTTAPEIGRMPDDLIHEGMTELLKHARDPRWICKFTEEKERTKPQP